VTSGGGVLDLSIGGNSTSSQQSGSAQYNQPVLGNFVATVNIAGLSATPAVIASLTFNGPNGLSTNISDYRQNFNTSVYNIGGFDPVTKSFPQNIFNLGQVSELQLSRVGDTFTESYLLAGASDFTIWHSFTDLAWDGLGGKVGLSAALPAGLPGADVEFSNFTITTNVPEPASLGLIGLGLAGLGFARRRKA
jgi:hypothetical protein